MGGGSRMTHILASPGGAGDGGGFWRALGRLSWEGVYGGASCHQGGCSFPAVFSLR